MDNNTDFVGHIDITPPLNEHEIEIMIWLGLVAAGEGADEPNVPANKPESWCEWSVCRDGCCLLFNAAGEPSGIATWLRYLMGHFLKPTARNRGQGGFENCTFNHLLDGIVVGCRRDTKEITQVSVRKNRVTTRLIRAGAPDNFGYRVSPTEQQRTSRARPGSKSAPRKSGTVIDLNSRRAGL